MREACQLSADFSRALATQKADYFETGNRDLDKPKDFLDRLEKVDLMTLDTDNSKKAFWINIYNGMMNYLIVNRKLKGSLIRNLHILFLPKLNIGTVEFSLDDIEHGILRRNKRASYKPMPQFGKGDERLQHLLETLDFRIHFALNCGAASCPALGFYSCENINKELRLAERDFVKQNFRVERASQKLNYSEIFKMYEDDFGAQYLGDPAYKSFKKKAISYDWTIS